VVSSFSWAVVIYSYLFVPVIIKGAHSFQLDWARGDLKVRVAVVLQHNLLQYYNTQHQHGHAHPAQPSPGQTLEAASNAVCRELSQGRKTPEQRDPVV
jgi:hypothetical protein